MISQEAIILFVAVLLVALLTISALYAQIQSASNKAYTVGQQVQGSISKDFVILSIYDKNVYVKGVSGELNVARTSIVLNGIPQTFSYAFLRDAGANGFLDPNDLVVFQIEKEINEGDCLIVDIDGVSAPWGNC